ncbi:MAG: peptidylprolyl isomerase [Chlorobi bacterium]|nr:peptidylprolyl isomerase [Chlorobiota bacterium]
MRMKFKMTYFLPVILLFLIACGRQEHQQQKNNTPSENVLMETNRYLAEKDGERITSYIQRHGWNMQHTGTGLWYEIYVHGTGTPVTQGRQVTLDYTLSLLDGTVCYSSETAGPKSFTAGRGGVEAGLEQGVLMLREGDRARFILPPWLAYGVPGDRNKIPPRSVIVYDVKILSVK